MLDDFMNMRSRTIGGSVFGFLLMTAFLFLVVVGVINGFALAISFISWDWQGFITEPVVYRIILVGASVIGIIFAVDVFRGNVK